MNDDNNEYYLDEGLEHDNCERDTFYALTDGMYGDYEDSKESGGDIDTLMDSSGF